VRGERDLYEMKLSGMTYRQIAEVVKLAPSTVYERIKKRIAEEVQPLADELRAVEVDRLDRWLRRLDAQIEADQYVARNVEVAVRVSERRAKLLGIDAPEKVEAVITEVTQEDIALGELVREAQAAAAVSEQRLREATS
jgi:DNA-binding Lrp family transcriptional regulator